MGLTARVFGQPFADTPYNPSYVWVPSLKNHSTAYVLSPKPAPSKGLQLQSLDFSATFQADEPPLRHLSDTAPLLDENNRSVIPVTDSDGLPLVYSGNCQSERYEIWKFVPDENNPGTEGEWQDVPVNRVAGSKNEELKGPNFLASSVTFSYTNDEVPSDIFLFGGMCPVDDGAKDDWVSMAKYSRDMLLLSAEESSYGLSTVPIRSPPVAEAGFSMTPLLPAYTNSSTGKQFSQQSFVLIGGHTQREFVGTSEIALLSLPESSWSYITVSESAKLKNRLDKEQKFPFEPRSGHTAVLSPDGTKIIVIGGWVGETAVPAQPQIAILRLGMEYGGKGSWTWDVPQQSDGIPDLRGIFGHGTAMLPGGIVVVTGGYEILPAASASSDFPPPNKRMFLFNATSESWATSYDLPSQINLDTKKKSGPLSSTSQKAGMGVGIGVGVSALAALAIALFCYRTRSTRQHRKFRDQRIRNLALGAERPHLPVPDNFEQPMVEANTESSPFITSLAYTSRANDPGVGNNEDEAAAEQTGLLLDTSSPTRSPRRENSSRYYQRPRRHSTIDRIDEKEEYQAIAQDEIRKSGSHHRSRSSLASDPFLDPPSPVKRSLGPPILPELPLLNDNDAEGYSWLETVLRGRRSITPGKNIRTLSNLSKGSGSAASISSRRSNTVDRATSNSPTSQLLHNPAFELDVYSRGPSQYTFGSTDTPPFRNEVRGSSIMGQGPVWLTQPESTLKTPRGPRSKALQWAGHVRRAIGSVRRSDVSIRPHSVALEGGSGNVGAPSTSTSPAKSSFYSAHEKMSDSNGSCASSPKLPRRAMSTNSTTMLGRKQGARDWDAGKRSSASSSVLLRSRTLAASPRYGHDASSRRNTRSSDSVAGCPYDDDEDWDVEAAAEGREVQVTYTVPKKRLRVVNAGAADDIDDDDDYEDNDNGHKKAKNDEI